MCIKPMRCEAVYVLYFPTTPYTQHIHLWLVVTHVNFYIWVNKMLEKCAIIVEPFFEYVSLLSWHDKTNSAVPYTLMRLIRSKNRTQQECDNWRVTQSILTKHNQLGMMTLDMLEGGKNYSITTHRQWWWQRPTKELWLSSWRPFTLNTHWPQAYRIDINNDRFNSYINRILGSAFLSKKKKVAVKWYTTALNFWFRKSIFFYRNFKFQNCHEHLVFGKVLCVITAWFHAWQMCQRSHANATHFVFVYLFKHILGNKKLPLRICSSGKYLLVSCLPQDIWRNDKPDIDFVVKHQRCIFHLLCKCTRDFCWNWIKSNQIWYISETFIACVY